MPEEAVERGAMIFVAPEIFRVAVAGLVAANLYNYAAPAGDVDEFILPGTNARVVKAPGLAGSLKIAATLCKRNISQGSFLQRLHL